MAREENNGVKENKNGLSELIVVSLALFVCAVFLFCTSISPLVDCSIKTSSESVIPEENIGSEITVEARDIYCQNQSEEDLQRQIREEEWLGELELLATLVEAEAGNQDLDGKRLVADVVLNRMESEDYPNTITEVIYQDNQFSTVLDGALEKASFNISDESFEAVRIEALESEERLDEEILFFTAGGYNSYCKPAYKYGDHYFGY